MPTAPIRALLAFAILVTGAGSALPAPSEALKLAGEVHDIFEAKCTDCHGPEIPRPKGKFGYVLDLKKMASNPEYIVPGKPEKSDLYRMVEDEEMPGEDANVPPLTSEEKATVKRWIEIGAPGDLPPRAGHEAAAPKAAPPKPREPFLRHFFRWAGRFHPLTTHFPVALMFVAAFAEGIAWASGRDKWLQTVRFLIILAALGAVGASVSGWVNAYFSSYNKEPWALLWWHRWLGTATGVWCVICAASSGARPRSDERRYFRVALFVGAVLVAISGFLGSALIYGLNHYQWTN